MGKKKKSQSPMMVMGHSDVTYRRRLLERWGFICVICGHEFTNLACVTKEHVIPKSAPAHLKPQENLAPSHHQCNKLRETGSILAAAAKVEEMRLKMTPQKFLVWLNKPVPHRVVPPEAMSPLRQRQFMELPEYLPGMRG